MKKNQVLKMWHWRSFCPFVDLIIDKSTRESRECHTDENFFSLYFRNQYQIWWEKTKFAILIWYAFLTVTAAFNFPYEFLLKHQFVFCILYNLASFTAICSVNFGRSLAMSLSHISFSLHRRFSNQNKKRWSPAHQRATEN